MFNRVLWDINICHSLKSNSVKRKFGNPCKNKAEQVEIVKKTIGGAFETDEENPKVADVVKIVCQMDFDNGD